MRSAAPLVFEVDSAAGGLPPDAALTGAVLVGLHALSISKTDALIKVAFLSDLLLQGSGLVRCMADP